MLDKIEMSLEDIIKSNKSSKFGNKRRAGASAGGSFGKSPQNKKFGGGSGGGGISKGRARGGITRTRSYTRVRWKDQKWDEKSENTKQDGGQCEKERKRRKVEVEEIEKIEMWNASSDFLRARNKQTLSADKMINKHVIVIVVILKIS